MEHQEYLLTLAQVASAFVGFSMLISAISPRIESSDVRRSLLYDVAQIGFMVIGGSLVPYAIAATSLSVDSIWRISSVLLLVTWLIAASLAYRQLDELSSCRCGEN